MRARTQSFALLPATSVLATLVLTVAWWITKIGLTEPSAPHVDLILVSVALGAAMISVATHPRLRTAFAQWVFRQVGGARRHLAPDVAHRWCRVARSVVGPAAYDMALLRRSLPRAPGGDPITV